MGPLSCVSVFNLFIVMASTNEYARKIFNSPTHAEPWLVASANDILQPDNWVFLTGKVHVDYRKILNTLFTRKALGIYLRIMESISRKHYAQWLADAEKDKSPKSIMMTSRALNMETSLSVFCGQHIPHKAIVEIEEKYWLITKALQLVNFPLNVPGTNVYNACQARKIAMKWLEGAAKSCKEYIKNGGEVECMLDAWVVEINAAKEKTGKEFSDREMAMVIFSFLFASQDAMSSGVIFLFQHLADRPEMLAKVREEQLRVRGDANTPMTLEMLDEMVYLKAFVKESLRLVPPVTMVPYKAIKPFPISPDYTVPAGSMVIPSIYPSLHDPEVFPEPEKLIPERWMDPESTANNSPKSYLVFGSGPHRCIGIEYANMHMACAIGTAAILMDWDHQRTPDSDDTEMIATVFPKDGCLLSFSPRN